ncbi:MAG TPA: transglutaminase-like domain-containing protein [Acidimicrobiales bacterium]|nr:transglutaminase-like domain-containing protein [Acidimicrobiales bacterium]
MDATARFVELVHRPEGAIPLDEAALLIAAHAHPDLDPAAGQARLDEIAGGVLGSTLDALRRHLFVELGFTGDDVHYHDLRNSFLDDVLERRVGIPITLSVVMIEVGRRVGVPLSGVSMPGHFLVRDGIDPDVFVDAFARGAVLDEAACRQRFHQVHGPGAEFDPAFLRPVGTVAIITRMLGNLEGIATTSGDRDLLSWVLTLRSSMPDAGGAEHRKLAAVLASSGRFGEAAGILDRLAGEHPDEASSAQLAQAAHRLRAKLN